MGTLTDPLKMLRDRRRSNLLKKLIVVSILLVLFRLPIFAILSLVGGLDIRELARLIVILPILVTLFYFLKAGRIKSFDKYPVLLIIIFTIALGINYSLILNIFYSDLPLTKILRVFSIFHFFLIFPFFLVNLRLEKQDYRYIIDKIVSVVLNIGGLLIIFEGLGYYLGWFTPEDTRNFLSGGIYFLRTDEYRPIGILANASASGILLAACTAYYFVQKILYLKIGSKHIQRLKYRWSTIIIGIISVFVSGSLTAIFILIVTILLSILIYYKSPLKLFYVSIAAILFFVCFRFFPTFDVYNYFLNYLHQADKYIPIFLPALSWDNFHYWGYHSSPNFNTGEFHFFDYAVKYGFLIFLPCFILIFFPLLKMIRLFPTSNQDKAPMILCLVFLLAIAHYSGLERWGNNYLYTLAVIMLFKKDSRPPTYIGTKGSYPQEIF